MASQHKVDFKLPKKRREEHAKSKEYRDAYDDEKQLYLLAESLRKIRKQKRYTQGKLAKIIGMKQQEISRIEKGYPDVKVGTLRKIAHGVGKKLILKLG